MSATECEQVLRELEVFRDRELSEEECRRIERHLADCANCSDREEFLRSLRDVIRRKCGTAELPAGLAERVRRMIASTD